MRWSDDFDFYRATSNTIVCSHCWHDTGIVMLSSTMPIYVCCWCGMKVREYPSRIQTPYTGRHGVFIPIDIISYIIGKNIRDG